MSMTTFGGLDHEQTVFVSSIGPQNRNRMRALDTRDLVASDIIGNTRKKSDRVSAALPERTLAAHEAARI